jgi:hypothetical protein
MCIKVSLSMSYHVHLYCSHLIIKFISYHAENPGLYKDKDSRPNGSAGGKATNTKNPDGAAAGRREAASDEFMLQRFRKREKFRVMRR